MALIYGIIIAYALLTLPLLVYVAYKVYMRLRHGNKPEEMQVIKVDVSALLIAIEASHKSAGAWFEAIRNDQKELRRDNQAMLQAIKAIAQGLIDIKGIAQDFSKGTSPEKGLANFVHALEYARDKFTTTKTQRETMEKIIGNIVVKHGTESR